MNWRSLDWVAKTKTVLNLGKKTVPATLGGVLMLVAAQAMPACSSTVPDADNSGGTKTTTKSTPDATTGANTCEHPAPGCPCTTDKETAPCGKVFLKQGDFTQCEMGTTTCDGKTWGDCDGSIKTSAGVISGGGVGLQSLGQAMACGTANACDPFCYVQVDTPSNIDGGSKISATEAGLTIAAPPNLNTCKEATNETTVLGAVTSTWNGSPGPCTAGSSTTLDNCNSDEKCTGGSCAPYADGTLNASTGCNAKPDFTVGVGCWDSSDVKSLELEVCNRGSVIANAGSLVVGIFTPVLPASPLTTSSLLSPVLTQCPSGSEYPSLAGILALPINNNSGTCTIPLATLPIGPGECISFPVNNAQSNPVSCKGNLLGSLTPTTSQLFAVVNPQLTTGSLNAPLAECDPCNNYTAINPTIAPPASTNAGLCKTSWCGVVANSSTTSCGQGLSTSLTGIVTDPGNNVPLSNVAVYAYPTGTTMLTIPDEPGGTTAPKCDNCTSTYLVNPNYAAATPTDVNGAFTLNVNPGSYTVVAQIGRWRRIVYSQVAVACVATPVKTDADGSLRMPSRQASSPSDSGSGGGDIPKMAIVEGREEAIECWLAKVGISPNEIAPWSSSGPNTNRIHLYSSTQNPGENYWNSTTMSAVVPPAATTLWGASGANAFNGATNTLYNYSAILIPCDGSEDDNGNNASNQAQTAMTNFVNQGGRLFLNHWGGQTWVEHTVASSGWNGSAIATWNDSSYGNGAQPAIGTVLNSTTDQQAMNQWINAHDTSAGMNQISSTTPRYLAQSIPATSNATPLVTFPAVTSGSYNEVASLASFWFNAPITNSPGSYCGRVVYNDMHVSPTRSNANVNGQTQGGFSTATTFPGSCSTGALSSEELALEYELFQLSACGLGTSPPVIPTPPPPPTPLTSTTFTRIFRASCGSYTPKWGFFEWEGALPAGTSVTFKAQTAADAAGNTPGTFGAAVSLGAGATPTNTSLTSYTASDSVDTDLVASGQTSQDWLEVTFTLNPDSSGMNAPVLTTWRQLYDCIP